MEYTLEIKDILAFVASKQDHERVGTTCSSQICLGASTLRWKYGKRFSTANVDFWCVDDPEVVEHPVGRGVTCILYKFDHLGGKHVFAPITKRQLLDSGILDGLTDPVERSI